MPSNEPHEDDRGCHLIFGDSKRRHIRLAAPQLNSDGRNRTRSFNDHRSEPSRSGGVICLNVLERPMRASHAYNVVSINTSDEY